MLSAIILAKKHSRGTLSHGSIVFITQIILFFYINTINYMKNNNIYNTNNTIFYINIFNYSNNNNIKTQIILFLILILLIIITIMVFLILITIKIIIFISQ
jgi:hypothetical protein